MRKRKHDILLNKEVSLGVKHFFPRPMVPFVAENEKVVPSPLSHIVGLFQDLIPLDHPNLCEYVELVKGKHDRICVISEYYGSNLRKKLDKLTTSDGYMGLGEDTIRDYAFVILKALVYLHEREIHHANLTPENIMFDNTGTLKLADYGLQYMTRDGQHVSFVFGNPKYMPPEMIGGKVSGVTGGYTNPKGAVWALGLILWELVTGKHPLAFISDTTPEAIFSHLISMWNESSQRPEDAGFQHTITTMPEDADLFEHLVEKWANIEGEENGDGEVKEEGESETDGVGQELSKISPQLRDLIGRCLVWNPKFRPTVEELLRHPYFQQLHEQTKGEEPEWSAKPFLKCTRLPDVHTLKDPEYLKHKKDKEAESKRETFTLAEIFYFWKLLGGSVESEVEKLYISKPAIQKLPFLVPLNKFSEFYAANTYKVRNQFGTDDDDAKVADPSTLYDDGTHVIPLDTLRERLAQPIQTTFKPITAKTKEQNFEYQRHRLHVFREILRRFEDNIPQATHELSDQAKIDIPPLLRGEIWRALLGIRGTEYISEYAAIDILRTGPSDKQIMLDIPRCHQYHPLLASPSGHKKFKRILKAWVASNNVLVYWQGLDSTLAPFLALHFTNEGLALACLQKFMNKYLQNFYTKDNALALQEYLSSFRQIVAYHDPQLASHLHDIDFQPDLYAIPWFLTSFTHIFPLDRVYPLWDALLQGPAPLPLFMAAAIIMQLRALLLTLDFNNAILLFSNLPSIDINECIKEAQRMFDNTPMSASLSSYTKDGKHWWEKRIPPKMAKKELAPRIAVHDVINMSWPFTILDIRPFDEFQKIRYPRSVWVNLRDKSRPITTPNDLEHFRNTHIIAVGAKDEAASFANQLVKFNYPHVSVLNGGMDALKTVAEPLLVYGEKE